jgi:hypothetical protein
VAKGGLRLLHYASAHRMTDPDRRRRLEVTPELLRRPWALSQRHLLTEKDFLGEANRREYPLSPATLEALHQHGVLIPWLRVDRDIPEIRRELRRKEPSPWRWELVSGSPPTTAPGLVEEWSAGRVMDASAAAFGPWGRRDRSHRAVSYRAWDFLYSPYQLLLLPDCRDTLSLLGRQKPPQWMDSFLLAHQKAALQERSATLLLTELEFVYYASVRRRYSMPINYGSEEDYEEARRAFDPVAVLTRTEWTPDALLKATDRWLSTAHSRDPLRNWTALVSLVDPRKWERLEGEALLAMDFRIAAEMVLRFLEDLSRLGAAPPLPDRSESNFYHPRDDRIGRQRSQLDRVLTEFGISPHPAVILILEGPSEMYIISKLMKYFGIPQLDSFIRLQLLGGVDKQIELLARYVAPALGRTRANLAEMDRPPTRLMVVVDQEKTYATPAGRARAKEQLVKHLYHALEPQHRTPAALKELAYLVEIETWGSTVKSLEFAHFTNYTIASQSWQRARRHRERTSPHSRLELQAFGPGAETSRAFGGTGPIRSRIRSSYGDTCGRCYGRGSGAPKRRRLRTASRLCESSSQPTGLRAGRGPTQSSASKPSRRKRPETRLSEVRIPVGAGWPTKFDAVVQNPRGWARRSCRSPTDRSKAWCSSRHSTLWNDRAGSAFRSGSSG